MDIIFLHICMESIKIVMKNLFTEKQWRSRYREQTYGREEEIKGEMYGKSNMETYTTICKTDRQC